MRHFAKQRNPDVIEVISNLKLNHETLLFLLSCEGASYFIDHAHAENWCILTYLDLTEQRSLVDSTLPIVPVIADDFSKPPFFPNKELLIKAYDQVSPERLALYLSFYHY